jgi:hypothetical protein
MRRGVRSAKPQSSPQLGLARRTSSALRPASVATLPPSRPNARPSVRARMPSRLSTRPGSFRASPAPGVAAPPDQSAVKRAVDTRHAGATKRPRGSRQAADIGGGAPGQFTCLGAGGWDSPPFQVSRAPARVPRADHSGVKLQGRSGMSVCRRRVCSSSHTPIEHWSSFAPRSAWVRAGDHSLARLSSTPQG